MVCAGGGGSAGACYAGRAEPCTRRSSEVRSRERERSITGLGRARYGRAREGIRLSYHISHLVSVAGALCRSLTHTSPS